MNIMKGELMKKDKIISSEDLKAIAYCGQSDGYLSLWALERINKAPGTKAKAVKACRATEKD
jgi:hypothetical protein